MQSHTALRTQHIQGPAAFEQLANDWDRIAQSGITDTPFQHLAYQRAWWTHLGSGDLHTVAVYDGDEAIAIGCFYLLDGVLQFNASKEETDYLDILVSAENAPAAWNAIIDCICTDDFPAWTTLDCWNLPSDSPSRSILQDIAAQRGYSFATERAEVCPVITLTGSFDDYLAATNKKQRHEIKRKMRRAKGAEAELMVVGPEHNLEQEIVDFLDLLQKSTSEKDAWLNPGRTALFQDASQSALDAGMLDLLFLVVDGQKVAALYNFNYKGRTWVYNSGLDTAAFSHLSAGVVLSSLAIERATQAGHTTFDFLRGDEAYKYRFGAQDTEIFRISITK